MVGGGSCFFCFFFFFFFLQSEAQRLSYLEKQILIFSLGVAQLLWGRKIHLTGNKYWVFYKGH